MMADSVVGRGDITLAVSCCRELKEENIGVPARGNDGEMSEFTNCLPEECSSSGRQNGL